MIAPNNEKRYLKSRLKTKPTMTKERNDDELIEVYSSSPLEAQMVNSLLQDAEIDTFIKDELMGSIAPWYVAGGGAGAVKIVINSRDYDRARAIIDQFEANKE